MAPDWSGTAPASSRCASTTHPPIGAIASDPPPEKLAVTDATD
jgi:hypothetical protein